jgi:hypothetical protein
MLTSS